LATLKQLADHVGVSVRTVSVVLNGRGPSSRISKQRIQQIHRAAAEIGYRPSSAARNLRKQRSRQVGVLIRNRPEDRFTHPLAYEYILGINEGLQEQGFVMVLARIGDVETDLKEQSRVFAEHALDAMIVIDHMPEAIEQRLSQLFPCNVWCDSNVWRDVGCIRRDERQAGRLIGQAAIDLGYREAHWLTYSPEVKSTHFSSKQRLDGLRGVFENKGFGLSIQPESVLDDPRQDSDLIGYMRCGGLVIADSIYQAQRLHRISEAFGLRPGHDYGLMCTDDWQHLNRYWPDLTRVGFNRFGMGKAAAAMALRMIDKGANACPSSLQPNALHVGASAWGPINDPS
jgi:DNA-binding LacI/PurR family transcriptional regulator